MTLKVDRNAIIEVAKKLPPNIVAVEGVWDGDSSGWFVMLYAIEKIENSQYEYHNVAYIGHGLGEYHDFMRSLAGKTPPYPEGLIAKEIGQEVADMLDVPFYFPSPEKPTLEEIPCWIDWKEGRVSSRPIHLINQSEVLEKFAGLKIAVVEAFWKYFQAWYPSITIVTVNESGDGSQHYEEHYIGDLYWDEPDKGRIIHGKQIPNLTPVEEAKRLGKLLAEALDTNFYFESSDEPKWGIPRWVDTQNTTHND